MTGYLASRGAHELEDLAAETFLQVARNIQNFEGGEEAFRSWVFVISHRRLIDVRRKRGRSPELSRYPTTTARGETWKAKRSIGWRRMT